jgi:hypothetical protein
MSVGRRLPEGSASAPGTEQREATWVERRRNALLGHTPPHRPQAIISPAELKSVFVDGALDLGAGASLATASSWLYRACELLSIGRELFQRAFARGRAREAPRHQPGSLRSIRQRLCVGHEHRPGSKAEGRLRTNLVVAEPSLHGFNDELNHPLGNNRIVKYAGHFLCPRVGVLYCRVMGTGRKITVVVVDLRHGGHR